MTKLHQVIAVERGVAADTEKRTAEVKHVFSIGGERDPLTGLSRVYESRRGEEGDQLPAESRKVQLTVTELLQHLQEQLARLFDVKFTREYANCSARADIVVDGDPLVKDVPAGYLLFLETQLVQLVTGLIERIPVLDPAEDWDDTDPALPAGVWKSAVRKKERTRRVPKYEVMVDPTPEHRAEIRQWETDEIEGYWTNIRFSGQLPERDVQAMRARAVKLLEAVRYAREHANELEVTDRKAGDILLGYVFSG